MRTKFCEQKKVKRWIVGITGASGSIYGLRLTEVLLHKGYDVHLVVTEAGWRVFKEELALDVYNRTVFLEQKFPDYHKQLFLHPIRDIGANIASGSFQVEGMVVMPCSMGTLASIAHGLSHNLLTRAADCMLKEARPLLIVPRETPLHATHLENMLTLVKQGVRLIPAMPAFYHNPQTIDDLVDFLVGKVLDQMYVEHHLFKRWGSEDDTDK